VFILYSLTQGGPPSSAYEKEEGEGMKNGWRSEKEEQENNNNTEKNKNNGRALSPGLETLQQTLYNHGKQEKIFKDHTVQVESYLHSLFYFTF
jgi:hypothetical protein